MYSDFVERICRPGNWIQLIGLIGLTLLLNSCDPRVGDFNSGDFHLDGKDFDFGGKEFDSSTQGTFISSEEESKEAKLSDEPLGACDVERSSGDLNPNLITGNRYKISEDNMYPFPSKDYYFNELKLIDIKFADSEKLVYRTVSEGSKLWSEWTCLKSEYHPKCSISDRSPELKDLIERQKNEPKDENPNKEVNPYLICRLDSSAKVDSKKTQIGSFRMKSGLALPAISIEEKKSGMVECYSEEKSEWKKTEKGIEVKREIWTTAKIGNPNKVSDCGAQHTNIFNYKELKFETGKLLDKKKIEILSEAKK